VPEPFPFGEGMLRVGINGVVVCVDAAMLDEIAGMALPEEVRRRREVSER